MLDILLRERDDSAPKASAAHDPRLFYSHRCCVTSRLHITIRGIWLDELSADVQARIALHVSHGEQDEDTLSLAKTSPALRHAVLSVVHLRLIVTDHYTGRTRKVSELQKWMDLFGEDVAELEISYLAFSGGRTWFTRPLALLPKLRAVRIAADPRQLAAIAGSSSITDVSLTFQGHASPIQA